jgi:hypothetical protein
MLLMITCSASCEVHGEYLIKIAEVRGAVTAIECGHVQRVDDYCARGNTEVRSPINRQKK